METACIRGRLHRRRRESLHAMWERIVALFLHVTVVETSQYGGSAGVNLVFPQTEFPQSYIAAILLISLLTQDCPVTMDSPVVHFPVLYDYHQGSDR